MCEVYFDPAVAMEEKIIFNKFVHEHLLQHARDVERASAARRAKDNSPAIHRWVSARRGNESRQGRKKSLALRCRFFRPSGAYGILNAFTQR